VAEIEGKIIDTLQSIPMKVLVNDRSLKCILGGDAAVHRDYRRMGVRNRISQQLIGKRIASTKMLYTVTRNPIAMKMLSKERDKFPFKVLNLTRIRNIDLQLKAMPMPNPNIIRLGFKALKTVNSMRSILAGAGGSDLEPLRGIEDFLSKADSFWKKIKEEYSYSVERDREFLEWRYVDERGGNYEISYLCEEDQLVGFLVSTVNRINTDYPVGFIVDMLTLPGRMGVANILVKEAVRVFDEDDGNIVNVLSVKGHPFEKIYKRYGFLDSRVDVNIFHTEYGVDDQLQREINQLNVPERIHFTYGDIDSLQQAYPR